MPQIRLVRPRDKLRHHLNARRKFSASKTRSLACAMSSTKCASILLSQSNITSLRIQLQRWLLPLVSSPRRPRSTRSTTRRRHLLKVLKGRSKPLRPSKVKAPTIHQPTRRTSPKCATLLLPKRSYKVNALRWLRPLETTLRAPWGHPWQPLQEVLHSMLASEWLDQLPRPPKRAQSSANSSLLQLYTLAPVPRRLELAFKVQVSTRALLRKSELKSI